VTSCGWTLTSQLAGQNSASVAAAAAAAARHVSTTPGAIKRRLCASLISRRQQLQPPYLSLQLVSDGNVSIRFEMFVIV